MHSLVEHKAVVWILLILGILLTITVIFSIIGIPILIILVLGFFSKIKQLKSPELLELENIQKNKHETENLLYKLNENIESYKKDESNLIKNISTLKEQIDQQKATIKENKNQIHQLANDLEVLNDLNNVNIKINEYRKELASLEEDLSLTEFGFYKPIFNFSNIEGYKEELKILREKQKLEAKNIIDAHKLINFTLDGSLAKGQQLVKSTLSMLVRSFNSECDDFVEKVKFNTIEIFENRMKKSFDSINRLGNKVVQYGMSNYYLDLKIKELKLAYEYAKFKEEEKERQREEREKIREAKKLEEEIKVAKEKINKERQHYLNELERLLRIEVDELNRKDVSDKLEEVKRLLDQLSADEKQLDYRLINNTAGYVYIISNLGSFGDKIHKIGVTRRLDPYDRIKELGDASVPFVFDTHALIFSDDAFKLENILHKTFEERRVNKVNFRKEFFNVSLDEIKRVINDHHDKTVDFIDVPVAEQYRETLKIS